MLSEGGAFQISLSQLQVDFYPYHLANGNRSAWIRYQEGLHATWLSAGLAAFLSQLMDAFSGAAGMASATSASANAKNAHSPLTRAGHNATHNVRE